MQAPQAGGRALQWEASETASAKPVEGRARPLLLLLRPRRRRPGPHLDRAHVDLRAQRVDDLLYDVAVAAGALVVDLHQGVVAAQLDAAAGGGGCDVMKMRFCRGGSG